MILQWVITMLLFVFSLYWIEFNEKQQQSINEMSSMSSPLFNSWANQQHVVKTVVVYTHAGKNEDKMKNNP